MFANDLPAFFKAIAIACFRAVAAPNFFFVLAKVLPLLNSLMFWLITDRERPDFRGIFHLFPWRHFNGPSICELYEGEPTYAAVGVFKTQLFNWNHCQQISQ